MYKPWELTWQLRYAYFTTRCYLTHTFSEAVANLSPDWLKFIAANTESCALITLTAFCNEDDSLKMICSIKVYVFAI